MLCCALTPKKYEKAQRYILLFLSLSLDRFNSALCYVVNGIGE